ncbi:MULTISPECIES: hypothetical protein [Bifidobacterium]|uniref:Uncharacterized protein n=2 Tax=Bifidobacterium TaxID=1678 RepID=A0A2M9HTQ9_9BIFI|nr:MULTISPECIES: hypothetical protein [Bifidobacterium]PJM80190.1 hypothetical protein CUU80_02830 [Bifidobacterium scaligerum]
MAMASCRLACTATDVIRGKLGLSHLNRAMTKPCLDRLQTMQYLLDAHMLTHPELKAKLCYLPVVPTFIDGTNISKDTLEMAVFVMIGKEDIRVNLKLRFIGSRWMCVYADLG